MEILEHRLDRRLDKGERARVGVSQLRRFLEQLLQRRCALEQTNQHPFNVCYSGWNPCTNIGCACDKPFKTSIGVKLRRSELCFLYHCRQSAARTSAGQACVTFQIGINKA